ncbi:type VII secretion protein EccB [Nonomuraea sp. KC401]|uniref:type VII secretion protein EccB n=1 Tax=unclassified Nonomuraea TaxID=2593643 RepID=UPI0010FD2269|nr:MULTISPECIES: type VII secretion protein EccB [unclassified Nonomuraea]NBE99236.1 type VII secretion protein EccB [Nonomuraea sp. K271]TLF55993.1 type VII secretion protein EccB [Nonomuraea sp. KC401]
MQTQKDLYQAHRLMQQRLGLALLQAEPDVPETPMRRHNVATFCGIIVGVLIMAAFGIWGLLSPGNATKLEEPGRLLVEEETGAKYVYSQEQQRLLPVANYVSALLLLDTSNFEVRSVSAASLAKYPRGPLVGIAGAPDSLPEKDKLVKGPWSVCVTEAPDASGTPVPYVTLVGGTKVGGTPVGAGALVVTDGNQSWVIWNDTRMKVNDSGVRALNARPKKVPPTWVNAIPPGPDFLPPKVSDLGRKVRGPSGGRAAIGQVYTVQGVSGAAARWYVLLSDGLAPITLTQATLLLEDPAIKRAYGKQVAKPLEIDAATANSKTSRQNLAVSGLPTTLPKVVPSSSPLCSVYADTQNGSARAKVTVGGSMTIPPPSTRGDQEHFDQVLLPAGAAALGGLLPGDGQKGSVQTYFLLSDQGRKYPLTSADQINKLGYGADDVAPMPGNLVHLLPEGPTLDPADARSPLQVTAS